MRLAALVNGLFMASGWPAWAQDKQADAQPPSGVPETQRVTVTGSNVRRPDTETPSPIQVITEQDIKNSGFTSVQDVLRNITANGQGTLSQSFSVGFASGAAGVSLRGLTVGATLVLINGQRMAPYPMADDNQRSFVDIANIPFDAVERIEVLKDGASAIYGSDAIAGVVNIILKRTFVGARITADLGTSYKKDGTTKHVAGMFGFGDLGPDGYNVYIAAEVRKQDQIRLVDRGGSYTQTDFTANGGYNLTPGVPAPANPFVGRRPASATGYVTDASGAIVGFMPGCDAANLAAGRCTYQDQWRQIQPATENYNLLGRYTQNLGADWQLSLEGSYFESRAQQVYNPSRTFPRGFQGFASGPDIPPTLLPPFDPTTIPSTNPSFPAGAGVTSGVLFYNFLDLGPRITEKVARSTRLIAGVEGRRAGWDLAAFAGATRVRLDVTGRNTVDPINLQAALNSSADPYLVGGPNNPAVAAFVAPTLTTRDTSTLNFIHLAASRDLTDLPGGPLGLAVGVDLVRRTLDARQAESVEAGRVPFGGLAFAVGEQDVRSLYAELVAPLSAQLEADVAVRYDHYNLSGGKASPKLGIKYRAMPELALRATASRGFRAPGPTENGNAGAAGFTVVQDPELCPDPANPLAPGSFPSQCARGIFFLLGSNPALKAETSTGYTAGVIVEPSKGLSATLDFYYIKLKNQIVSATTLELVRGTNQTPIEQVQPDGSIALGVPEPPPFTYGLLEYINADSTTTSGVDLSLQFNDKLEGGGTFISDLTVSYTARYDVTIAGITYRLAGTHGPSVVSGNSGNPRTRARWANTFMSGPWQFTGTLNYISSFGVTDPVYPNQRTCLDALANGGGAASLPYQGVLARGEIPNGVSCTVRSFTTFDLYARYDISGQLSVHASVVNLFNRSAPLDWSTYGGAEGAVPWNPSFHTQGAIGRFFSVGATYAF